MNDAGRFPIMQEGEQETRMVLSEDSRKELKFTFKACYQLLQINPKSFLTWLKKANIDPERQRDKFDPRKKYLYRNQLEHLAAEHERELPEDLAEYADEMENAAVTIQALAEQLEAVQSGITQRFD